MTRKHFQMIADVIAESGDHPMVHGRRVLPVPDHVLSGVQQLRLAESFADRLAQYNPRFDRKRFIAAAVVQFGVTDAPMGKVFPSGAW